MNLARRQRAAHGERTGCPHAPATLLKQLALPDNVASPISVGSLPSCDSGTTALDNHDGADETDEADDAHSTASSQQLSSSTGSDEDNAKVGGESESLSDPSENEGSVDNDDDEEEQEVSDFDDELDAGTAEGLSQRNLRGGGESSCSSSVGIGGENISEGSEAVSLSAVLQHWSHGHAHDGVSSRRPNQQPANEGRSRRRPPIIPSVFAGGEAVLYFPREDEEVEPLPEEIRNAMSWKICKYTPKVVRVCLRKCGFRLVRGGKHWLGYWGKHLPVEKFKGVRPWQKVNHFPMSFEIGRKDRLYINAMRMKERLRDEQDTLSFLPDTFILPLQRRKLKQVFSTQALWIIKPPASARGNGIRVVSRWSDVPRKNEAVVCRYIMDPYLIDGRKFDIRLYVAVPSFDPLRIYLFREGIVRFAADKYSQSTQIKSVRNRFIHLTNYSVSKKRKSESFQETAQTFPMNDPRFCTKARKWSLDLLREYFQRQKIDFDQIMAKIRHIMIATIISTHSANSSGSRMFVSNPASCYELFGFDILLDKRLKPWLMEVNISPSLKASCELDQRIKSHLCSDLFNLIGFSLKNLSHCQLSAKRKYHDRILLNTNERIKHKSYSKNRTLNFLPDLTDDDKRVLRLVEDERCRAGQFERLFPSAESERYHSMFACSLPYYDRLLHQWIQLSLRSPKKAIDLISLTPDCREPVACRYVPSSSRISVSSNSSGASRRSGSLTSSVCGRKSTSSSFDRLPRRMVGPTLPPSQPFSSVTVKSFSSTLHADTAKAVSKHPCRIPLQLGRSSLVPGELFGNASAELYGAPTIPDLNPHFRPSPLLSPTLEQPEPQPVKFYLHHSTALAAAAVMAGQLPDSFDLILSKAGAGDQEMRRGERAGRHHGGQARGHTNQPAYKDKGKEDVESALAGRDPRKRGGSRFAGGGRIAATAAEAEESRVSLGSFLQTGQRSVPSHVRAIPEKGFAVNNSLLSAMAMAGVTNVNPNNKK